MASAVSRPMGEATTFSYAQAAKGRTASVAPTSTTQSSQAASGTNTPSRDNASSTNASVNASQAGGESENAKPSHQEVTGSSGTKIVKPESESGSKSSNANALSSPSSPSFGTASTSTLPKEEEISFTSNGAAEHGIWEKRSHNTSTVNTGDRYVEASEGRRGAKAKRGPNNRNKDSDKKEVEKEKEPVKPEAPLVAAPPPAVNIWAQRQEAAAKAKPVAQVPAKVETSGANGVGPAAKQASDQKRRAKIDENEKLGQAGGSKEAKTQKKSGSSDVRREEQTGKRTAPRGNRGAEKDEKSVLGQLPPSVDDAASWPTPDTVAEEKKKVQEKTVKEDENEDPSNKEKRPKETWTKIPFTPTAVFNTPLPPSRGRGNRGGARGGRDTGGRGGHMANGNLGGDKASTSVVPNPATTEGKDQRGRDNASAGRAASLPPNNSKRSSSDGPQNGSQEHRKHSITYEKAKQNGAQSAKIEQAPFESESRRTSVAPVNGSEFHPGAEFHQTPRQSRADFSQSDKYNQGNADSYGSTTGRDRRSESNARSVDGFNGSVGYTQQRGEYRTERGGRNRGRGNQSNFANGQVHLPAAFPNGQAMPMPNGFPVRQGPYSPPLNQQQYASTYGPPARGRGGRGQSISGNMYGRYNGVNGHHMSPIQTSGPMFGYQGMDPMTAMSAPPFNPYVDQYSLMTLVRTQLDYYFSVDNLCKDVFLRKHMDSQGFVFLSLIANFSRMQKLTADLEIIRAAAEGSDVIEFAQGAHDGIDRLRARTGWEQWVMPMDQRDAGARNAGPASLIHPQAQTQSQSAMPMLPGAASTFSPNGMEPVFQPFSMPQAGTLPPLNGHANGLAQQQETPLSAAVPNFAPGLPVSSDEIKSLESETTFKDEEIEGLIVVFRTPSRDGKSTFGPSRTFSNGSITEEFQNQDSRKGRSGINGTSDSSSPVRRSRSPFAPLSPTDKNAASGNGPTILWIKGQNQAAPVTSEVPDRTDDSYASLRAKALRHRNASHSGQTDHDMKILYEFWSHFLVRNFNPGMYEEFHTLALEDAYQRKTYVGISHLITYYDELLNSKKKPIHETIAKHYVQLVKQESGNEERPAFAKLRSAWRNGAIDMKSRKKIDNFVDAQLREELSR